jgi:ribosomal protein S18 acetylase RimI-like enzyme
VARSAPRVRPALESDLPALVELGTGLREALLPASDAGSRTTTPAGRAALEQRLREALASPERHLVVVVGDDDETLGMALLTVSSANALVDAPAVHMSHAVVDDGHKRRGAGRALVAAAAAYAEERGLDQVVVSVRPGSREANRFFARLGFAPLAVRRTASVVAIRRHMAQSEPALGAIVRRRSRHAGGLSTVPAQPLRSEVEP